MRHARGNRKLNKATDQRIALLTSLVESLFIYGKIKTTLKRAKEASRMANRVVTLLRKGDQFSKRKITYTIRNKQALKSINELDLARFEGKVGGYTRIIRIGTRRGDATPMVLLEVV